MKQTQFTEMISALYQGDRIRVSFADLEQELPRGEYEATVMGIERVGTFGFKALLNIPLQPELVQTKRFDLAHRFELLSWQEKPAVSVFAENLEKGDILTSWGHDIEVLNVQRDGRFYVLTTKDIVTNEVHTQRYEDTDRFLYKLRDLSEKEIRGIFEKMAPPITYSKDEDPQQVAKRIIRQAEEWTE